MRLSKYQLAVLALIGTNVIWGASIPIFKWSLTGTDPFTFAFIRFFLAALFLLPFTIHKLKITKHDAITFFVLAFFGFFVHISLLLFGLTISSAINSPIIASSAPIFLILGSFFFLKEKISQKVIMGTAISLIGVSIIILRPLFDHGLDGTILGNLMFLFSTLAFVVYTLLLKEHTFKHNAATVTFYLFAFSTVIFFPFFLWQSASHSILQTLDTKALFGIIFGAIFTSVLGYIFFNFAIRYVKASETGVFLYIDPLITVLIAVPLLGEHVTRSFVVGTILVFFGILVAEKRLPYHPFHRLFRKNP
jgi:drug/metabolite transporter (DMT)-like permease